MPATSNPYWIAKAKGIPTPPDETLFSRFFGDIGHYYAAGFKRAGAGWGDPLAHLLLHGTSTGAPAPAPATHGRHRKAKAPSVPEKTLIAAYEKAIATGPFAKIEQSTAAELAPAFSAAQSYVSGAQTPAAVSGAFSQALGDLRGAPGLSATPASWMAQALAAGQQAAAPLTAAERGLAAARASYEPGIAAELAAVGQGNEAAVMTAPENAWLQAIASGIESHMSYYTRVPKGAVTGLPAAVGKALAGLGGITGGATSVPITELTSKGPVVRVRPGATNVASGATGGAAPPSASQPPAGGGSTVRP